MTFYTPAEVAKQLKVSPATVAKLFAGKPGVVTIAHPRPGRRGYRTLRISAEAIQRAAQQA